MQLVTYICGLHMFLMRFLLNIREKISLAGNFVTGVLVKKKKQSSNFEQVCAVLKNGTL